MVDKAIVTNQAYINFTDAIIRTYFTSRGRLFDITTDYPALYNEVVAFIGGDVFDNEALARKTYTPMFQDFDAVADAWRRMEAAVRAKAGAREEARAAEDTAAPQDFIGLLLRGVLG